MAQYLALSRRATVGIFRQPAAIIPAIIFPLVFVTMTSAALDRSTTIPGFPRVDSFFQFAITATLVQGILFGAIRAGSDMATDIEDGFFERLIASPVARTSILVGRVMGAAALGFVQAWIYMAIGLAVGVDVEGGFLAMVLISVVAMVLAAGIGSIAVAIGLRTGSSEAVQGSFPLLFALLFLSSAFFPRDLTSGWYRTAATLNPLTHLIEGVRHQIIAGLDLSAWLTALGSAAGIFLVGSVLARAALRGRLAGHL